MKPKTQLVGVLFLAAASVALLAAPVGGAATVQEGPAGPPGVAVAPDWFERAAHVTPAEAVAPDWFERAALVAQQRAVAPDWFERAAMAAQRKVAATATQAAHQHVGIAFEPGAVTGLDVHERAVPPTGASLATGSLIPNGGFDWGAAAVGALSGFALTVLLGISLLTARHYRSRPLPR